MFSLFGMRAVVTGAAGGIGSETAKRLANAGATVALLDIAQAEEKLLKLKSDIDGKSFTVIADVSNVDNVGSAFENIFAEMGGIDILVNNAGIARAEDIFEMSVESWKSVIDVNLTGAFLCAKLAMTQMKVQGTGGRIIQLGSVAALQGALKGHVHYSSSKSGLHGMTRTLARTGGPLGITVNTVAPGVVDTELLRNSHGKEGCKTLALMVPVGCLATTADVASTIHFLATKEAQHINGATIDVNGGLFIH